MTHIQPFWAVLAILSFSPICSAEIDDLATGKYESDSKHAKLYWSTTRDRDFYAKVSLHTGISIPKPDAKGWDQKLTLKQVEKRVEADSGRKLAVVLLAKNYNGSEKPDESHTALVKLLLRVGFERVIVTQAHSRLTIIEEIHKSSEQGGAEKPATGAESKSKGKEKPNLVPDLKR